MSELPRSTIVAFVASCRGCPFQTRTPSEARSHAQSEGHMLAVTKHYLLQPQAAS